METMAFTCFFPYQTGSRLALGTSFSYTRCIQTVSLRVRQKKVSAHMSRMKIDSHQDNVSSEGKLERESFRRNFMKAIEGTGINASKSERMSYLSIIPLVPDFALYVVYGYLGFKFYGNFKNTTYDPKYKIPLTIAWPILLLNGKFRKNFTKAIKGGD